MFGSPRRRRTSQRPAHCTIQATIQPNTSTGHGNQNLPWAFNNIGQLSWMVNKLATQAVGIRKAPSYPILTPWETEKVRLCRFWLVRTGQNSGELFFETNYLSNRSCVAWCLCSTALLLQNFQWPKFCHPCHAWHPHLSSRTSSLGAFGMSSTSCCLASSTKPKRRMAPMKCARQVARKGPTTPKSLPQETLELEGRINKAKHDANGHNDMVKAL